ncbi:hypothetical protein [Actinomadura decatromicini]|uniref:Uncharacterized protein n=1 Tax=Actinomadura decatromicini TaxID=2604572 RepID=A0A5D3FIV8_9ACTN|nr:hypothetical protein [Actinomadura decatromicini]TYK47836.1 hypothetical protein FXF68_19250 [Actinomadura decatromicini]
MIILSGVLVVVAIALLVAGIVAGNGDSAQVFGLDALVVIYISIAVSIVSALCLTIGVFLRRKELFGTGAVTQPSRKARKADKPKRAKGGKAVPPAAAANARGVPDARGPAADPDDAVEIPAPPADVPDDALVFVVRGRKRYHLDTCRQLAGRETEELTYAEAKEEGFSPCTACLPDTALAARAAASAPASSDASGAAGDRTPSPKPGTARSDGGLVGLAKQPPSPPSPHAAPTAFDTTAELPRAERPAEPEPPRAPANPTLTDLPVASLAPAEEAPRPAERPEPAAPEPEEDSAPEPAAEAEPAPPAEPAAETSTPAEPEPETAAEAPVEPAAPQPRDSGDADVPHEGAQTDADADAAPAESEGDDLQVRILSGTKRYHRTDCALIEDIGDEADDLESLSRAEAKSRGCTPCLVCQPDRERARD